MSPLLLAYGVETRRSPPGERVPFKTGDRQLLCQTRKTFSAKESAVLFFQIYNLTEELKTSGTLRYDFLREDKDFLTRTNRVADARRGADVFDIQPLAAFPPGYYQVRVTLLDGQDHEMASAKANFEISLAAGVPRPLILAKVVPAIRTEDDLFTTGVQLLNIGDLEAARNCLADAHGRNPARPDIAIAYSQALLRSGAYRRAKEVLVPFAGGPGPVADVRLCWAGPASPSGTTRKP